MSLNLAVLQPGNAVAVGEAQTNQTQLVEFGGIARNQWTQVATMFSATNRQMSIAINGVFSPWTMRFNSAAVLVGWMQIQAAPARRRPYFLLNRYDSAGFRPCNFIGHIAEGRVIIVLRNSQGIRAESFGII